MKIDGLFFIIICYVCLFTTAIILNKKIKFKPLSFRFESIDGLRGLLATGVLIHHLIIWYNYLNMGAWGLPKNPVAVFIGKGSVYIFFMITAFLFTNKILKDKEGKKESKTQNNTFWKSVLYSRIYRLCPAYFLLISLLILLALFQTSFNLVVSLNHFLYECFQWFTFTIIGNPTINSTDVMLFSAGVIWSLPYEWLFYFTLPLIAIIFNRKINYIAIISSLCFLGIYFYFNKFRLIDFYPFLGGIISAIILKFYPKIKLNKIIFSCLVIVFFSSIILLRKFLNPFLERTLLIFIFIIISLGNDMFGLLKLRFLSLLGEISYSTYLFHSLTIYIIFNILGIDFMKNTCNIMYTIISCLICIAVVIISYLLYNFVEKKGINYYKHIVSKKLK